MKTALIVAAAFVVITTAANADGYRAATQLEQVKAQCELVADGMVQPDSPYYGDPKYAGFSTFGSAVGGAIRHARDYDNCMVLHGFAKDESPAPAPVVEEAPVAPAPPTMPVKPKAHATRSAQLSKARAPHDYIDDLPISAYEKCNRRRQFEECEANPQWDGK